MHTCKLAIERKASAVADNINVIQDKFRGYISSSMDALAEGMHDGSLKLQDELHIQDPKYEEAWTFFGNFDRKFGFEKVLETKKSLSEKERSTLCHVTQRISGPLFCFKVVKASTREFWIWSDARLVWANAFAMVNMASFSVHGFFVKLLVKLIDHPVPNLDIIARQNERAFQGRRWTHQQGSWQTVLRSWMSHAGGACSAPYGSPILGFEIYCPLRRSSHTLFITIPQFQRSKSKLTGLAEENVYREMKSAAITSWATQGDVSLSRIVVKNWGVSQEQGFSSIFGNYIRNNIFKQLKP